MPPVRARRPHTQAVGCAMQLAVAAVVSGLESMRYRIARASGWFIGDGLLAERERWLLWAPVTLALGVAGYYSLPAEPPIWAGPVWAGLFFALAILARRRFWLVLLFLALALAGCGLAAGQIRTMVVAAPVLQEKVGPVELRGRLVESGVGGGAATLCFGKFINTRPGGG